MFITTESGMAINSDHVVTMSIERFDNSFHILATIANGVGNESDMIEDEFSISSYSDSESAHNALKQLCYDINAV